MFVSQVNITEFKGIRRCKKPLELSDFTILIGRNNSGKSSVLEALSLLPLPFDYSLIAYGGSTFKLLSELHGGRSSLVYGYSGSASIKYKVHDKTWRFTLSERGSTADLFIEGLDSSLILQDPVKAVAAALKVKSKRELLTAISKKVFFIPNSTLFMNGLFTRLHVESNRNLIMKLGAHTRVAKELINECVDDRYTEILFTPELSARKELPNGNVSYIKLKDLGDGIEKAALVTLWLDALNPALVLWDDFEGSAHPSLIKVLLKWLCKKKWQVILSTHSIDVLGNLLDVRPKNAKVIQLKKTAGDILIHQDLDFEELESLIDANSDPRILVDRLEL